MLIPLVPKVISLPERTHLQEVNRTFVAVHFDGSGDSVITEEVKRFEPDYYVYGEHEPADCDATHLQEHFEALVPLGYENDCGGFGDVVLDFGARKISDGAG
jgi:hypothetical protein